MVDMTKVANIILYMLHKQVKSLNNKKIELMLFFMEKNHLDFFNQKIINEEFLKDKRGVKAKNLNEIFELIIDEVDLDEDDERIYFIQELLDFLEIDIIEKNGFKELNFSKFEEDFSEELFSQDELKTIHKVVNLYKDTTVRNLANECFSMQKVRDTINDEVIF